jgi:single stranded DNA-binding protein
LYSSVAGNLGADPRINVLPSGKEVVNLNLAVKRKVKEEEMTDWYSVECWNENAVQAKTYLAKGMRICVQGRMRIDEWVVRPHARPFLSQHSARVVTERRHQLHLAKGARHLPRCSRELTACTWV